MTYVFDTSSLVGAWVRSYPPDLFPGVWEHMSDLARAGQLIAPEDVLEELKDRDDELQAWVKARTDAIIVPTSRALLLEARAVLADHPGLTKTGTGRGKADPFVIALAAQRNCPVVTEEQGGSLTKPRIPFVCSARGVVSMSILDVIRTERWRFT